LEVPVALHGVHGVLVFPPAFPVVPLVSTLAGAAFGYAWYRVVGCSSGACPLTSRWWTSTLYGAFVGWTFAS
jgi:hypothetical protein